MPRNESGFVDSPPEELLPKRLSHFLEPGGLNTVTPLSRLDRKYSPDIMNLRIRDGRYIPRDGTRMLGDEDAVANVVGLAHIVYGGGVERVVRWLKTKMQVWSSGGAYPNPGSWTDVPALVLTQSNDDDRVSWTVWNKLILFTNNKDGLYSYDPATNTASLIAGAPAGKTVAVFNGRVIISGVLGNPHRIQWSAKNDHTDWIGVGSGFEDLLSSSGSEVDSQRAVIPVSDHTAIAVRSNSVWAIYETGNPDAPFRFARLYTDFGSNAPHTLRALPGAVIGHFRDSIYIVGETQRQDIGAPIADLLREYQVGSAGTPAMGFVDPKLQEYRYTSGSSDKVFRFSLRYQAWTRDQYLYEVRVIAPVNYVVSSMGAPRGLMLSSWIRTFVESSTITDDADELGVIGAYGWAIKTGYITLDPLYKTRIHMAELEARIYGNITLYVSRNEDGGSPSEVYGTGVGGYAAIANPSLLVPFPGVYEDRKIQLELIGLSIGEVIEIVEFIVYASLGSKENPT